MIQKISAEEADSIIRASWPARRADIDYALHTAECGDALGDDDDYDLPGGPMTALLGIGLLLIGGVLCAALMWLLWSIA